MSVKLQGHVLDILSDIRRAFCLLIYILKNSTVHYLSLFFENETTSIFYSQRKYTSLAIKWPTNIRTVSRNEILFNDDHFALLLSVIASLLL